MTQQNLSIAEYLSAGFSVIPVSENKTPTIQWKPFQTRQMTTKEWTKHFNGAWGLAVVAGYGNVEIIDIDNHFGDASTMLGSMLEMVQDNLPELRSKLVIISTKNGGFHLPYRCPKPEKNQKLASRLKDDKTKDVLIETRGEGGYVVAPPSPGYTNNSGTYLTIPTLTNEERKFLIMTARSFNQCEEDEQKQPEPSELNGIRPGDDYNEKTTIDEILTPHGWKQSGTRGNVQMWTRPGKNGHALSATYNHIPNKLYVWTTASNLQSEKTYSHFQIYAALNHNNDYKTAAKELRKQGYGSNIATATTKDNGKIPKATLIQVLEDYLNATYDFKYNSIKSQTEFKTKEQTDFQILLDRDVHEIWRDLNKQNYKMPKDTIENVINSHFVPAYDPIIDYFNNLPKWDGTERLQQYCNHIKAGQDQQETFLVAMARWATAAVGTAYGDITNHICPVFVGKQRVGKTTAIMLLVPKQLRDYCPADAHINPNDKDSKTMVAESFIINLDELERSTRDEIGHLKSLITTTQVTVRRPYGRRSETLKRRASFIGSVNKTDFLNDVTGNLRFVPIEFIGRELDYTLDVDQFWAEAKQYYKSNEPTHYTLKEYEKIEENAKKFTQAFAEEEILIDTFEPYDATGVPPKDLHKKETSGVMQMLTNTELLSELQKKTTIRLSPVKLGQFLSKHGYEKVAIKYGKSVKRVYLVKKAEMEGNEPF